MNKPDFDSKSDSEDLAMEHGQTGRLNTEEGAAEGRNTGDVSEADGRAEETEAKKTEHDSSLTVVIFTKD